MNFTTYEYKLLCACSRSSRDLEGNITFFVSMGVNSDRAAQLLKAFNNE